MHKPSSGFVALCLHRFPRVKTETERDAQVLEGEDCCMQYHLTQLGSWSQLAGLAWMTSFWCYTALQYDIMRRVSKYVSAVCMSWDLSLYLVFLNTPDIAIVYSTF